MTSTPSIRRMTRLSGSLMAIAALGVGSWTIASPLQSVPSWISALEPTSPRVGEVVYVKYNPQGIGAALTNEFERFAAMELTTVAGTSIYWGRLATGSDGVIEAWSIPLPSDAEAGTIRFFSLDPAIPGDQLADLRFTVLRDGDAGIAIDQSDEEIARRANEHWAAHPEDPTVWLSKWSALATRLDGEQLAAIVRSDLDGWSTSPSAESTAGRTIRVWAHVLLGDDAQASLLAGQMVEESPDDPWTSRAIELLEPLIGRDAEGRWKGPVRRLAEQVPNARGLRRRMLAVLADDVETPLSLVDACATTWATEQPEDGRPILLRAMARSKRQVEMEEADRLAGDAIELMRGPAFRAYADPRGDRVGFALQAALLVRAEAAEARGQSSDAFVYRLAARGAGGPSTASGASNVAGAWRAASGIPEQPIAAEIEAGVSTESAVVEDGAASLAAATNPSAATPSGADPAEVMLMDLEGQLIRLADFRGKVVVLNFWFTGCRPCRLEMPDLNQLADRFQAQDVVFLAPSLDPVDLNRSFLAEQPFRYRTLADAMPLAQALGVAAYPTHVVIDRTGAVVVTRVGIGDAVQTELAAAIERLLE